MMRQFIKIVERWSSERRDKDDLFSPSERQFRQAFDDGVEHARKGGKITDCPKFEDSEASSSHQLCDVWQRGFRTIQRSDEQADADDMYDDSSKLHTFARKGGQEFGDKGRADIPAAANNPRFADNSMLNEFADEAAAQVDQLHQWLLRHISDDEIIQGIKLTDAGKRKVAAKFGISVDDVEALLNTLRQNLTDEQSADTEMVLSDFDSTMGESRRPFEFGTVLEDRFSVEADLLGNVTVRDSKTGNARFVQGSAASELLNQIKQHGAEQVLAPLMEDLDHPSGADFAAEIEAPAGTYNFSWDYHGRHGFATAFYRTDTSTPHLRVEAVRDETGDEVEVDPAMHADLLTQARAFIGDE